MNIEIIPFCIGMIIFWIPYFLYKYFRDRYYKKKRAEWNKEMQTGLGNMKTANRIIKHEIRRNTKRTEEAKN